MFKNILIIGPGRAGKTTLAKMIHKKYGYSVIRIDDIVTAMEAFPSLGISWDGDAAKIATQMAPFLRIYLKELSDVGLDAMIIADIGVFMLVKEMLPDMEIHVSTQVNATSAAACLAWYKLGAKRIVLARELTLDEIKELDAASYDAMCRNAREAVMEFDIPKLSEKYLEEIYRIMDKYKLKNSKGDK